MWQEIERISGVPFPDRSRSGVEDELYGSRMATSLALDFQLASANEVENRHLQQDLIRASNHAAAVEIEAGNVRDRNRALSETVECLQEENASLRERLHNQEKAQHQLEDSEKHLASRVDGLERALTEQKEREERLVLDNSELSQELNDATSQNAVYQEKLETLQERLVALKESSEQRSRDAIAKEKTESAHATEVLKAEAKHNAAVLEAKIQSLGSQLEQAERREKQLSIEAQEARQEASGVHQKMHDNIASVRRDLESAHRTELEQSRKDRDKTREELEVARQELQQATLDIVKKREESSKSLMNLTHDLEGKTAQCDQLQAELDEVKVAKEQLDADVATLETNNQCIQKSKDDAEKALQTLKATLEDERHRHASHINGLESDVMALFSQQIK